MQRNTATLAFVALLALATTRVVNGSRVVQLGSREVSTISGRVIDGESGRPVGDATVSLAVQIAEKSASTPANQVIGTSVDGGFTFQVVGPATARFTVTKPGFLAGYLGMSSATDPMLAGSPLEIAKGEQVVGLVIKLWAEAAIVGSVHNDADEPLVNASVTAYSRIHAGSGTTWISVATQRSDDRGRYELRRLRPGDMVVAVRPAVPKSIDARSAPPFFSRSSFQVSTADLVTLRSGETRNVDIRLPGLQATTLVGELTWLGAPVRGQLVRISPESSDGADVDVVTARTEADGSFRIVGLPEGRYRIRAWQVPVGDASTFTIGGDFQRTVQSLDRALPLTPLPDLPARYVDSIATVETNREAKIRLELIDGLTISGRVTFDGATPESSRLLSTPVVIRPADGADLGQIPQPRIESDGRFRSIGLPPGRYVINVLPSFGGLSGWRTRSIRLMDREVLGDAFMLTAENISDVQIAMTDRICQVRGSVRSIQGDLPADVRVVLFPSESGARRQFYAFPAPRRVRLVTTNSAGQFVIEPPPGDYLAIAVRNPPVTWMTPDYLAGLAVDAVPVKATVGTVATVSLTVKPR